MQNNKKAYIFAGANASGKSTFITHLMLSQTVQGYYISPDIILKEELRLEESKENYMLAFKKAEQFQTKLSLVIIC
jgi:predicted ABC-type ATPase